MRVAILTLFPSIFSNFLETSLIRKAVDNSLLDVITIDIREFADPPHFKVDDEPYGGGAGMVLKPEPIIRAVRAAKDRLPNATTVLFSASGKRFTQDQAKGCAASDEFILICGRYEGVDQRVVDLCVDSEYSVGDCVLMGGEVPAMAFLEAVTRLKQDVLGNAESLIQESFASDHPDGCILEAPHYTRPPEFEGLCVPAVLLSGDHKQISEWRSEKSRERTQCNRPDLIKEGG